MTISDFIEGKIKEDFDKKLSSFLGEYLVLDSHFRKTGNGIKNANAFREKLFDNLNAWLHTFSQELLEKCGEEIIGEDISETYQRAHQDNGLYLKSHKNMKAKYQNELRAEQRSYLKGIYEKSK